MTRRLALLTTMLVLALPAVASAQQGGAFGPLPSADTPVPTATAVSTTADDGTTGRNILFIVGGVLIVGFGIMGWFILRDARGTVGEPELAGAAALRDAGAHKHKMQAKAKARKKTHAQKAARKAHRKR
jgi:hypothetical protein